MTTNKRWFIIMFLLLLVFNTCGQLSYKFLAEQVAPVDFSSAFVARLLHAKWVIAVVFSLAGAFFTYMYLIRVAPVGPMFAASHIEIVTVTLISVIFLGDHLTMIQILGCFIIIAGVVVLGLEGRDA